MLGGLGEAARIFITVGLDSAAAARGLSTLGKEVDGFGSKMGAWSKTVSSAFSGPLDAFGKLGDAADGVKSVIGAVGGLAQTLFSGAARNEQYATSFEVLLGSADKAQAHIEALTKYANSTPFTLPGIVEVSKQLEVMGGAALNTLDNMNLVGDVASGTGTDLERVGVQFGRMYDAMKNGTPMGEVLMRLGEMGALSGDSKREILKLSDAVKSGAMTMDQAWKASGKEFQRFAGMTGKQATTLSGLWSTFTDTIDNGFAKFGKKLLPVIKPVLEGAIKLFEKFGEAALWAVDNIKLIAPVILAVAVPAVAALAIAMWHLAAAVVVASAPFIPLGIAIVTAVGAFLAIQAVLERIFPGFDLLGTVFNVVTKAVEMFLGPLTAVIGLIGGVGDALNDTAGKAKRSGEVMKTAMDFASSERQDSINSLKSSLVEAGKAFDPIITGASDSKKAVDKALDDIVFRITTFRSEVKAVAEGVAGAMYDPIIAGAEVAAGQIALAEAKIAAAKETAGSLAAQVAEGEVARIKKDLAVKVALFKTYGTDSERLAYAASQSTWAAWQKAQNESDPEVKKALQDKWDFFYQWGLEMNAEAGKSGSATGLSWSTGLGSEQADRAARAAGIGLGNAAGAGLKAPNYYGWGAGAGAEFAAGLQAAGGKLTTAVKDFMNNGKGLMEFNSPAKEGAWREVDTWGERAGRTFADNLGAQASYLARAANDFMSGAQMGSLAPAYEGARAPSGATMAAGQQRAGGGLTLDISFASAVPYTPAEQNELGQRIGPPVFEYLRTRGIVVA